MVFNTFDFGFFLVLVYSLYWIIGVKNRRLQNVVLLLASYVFYGLWDWRFLFLLLGSSVVDFLCGIAIENSTNRLRQKLWLVLSIAWNLGVLMLFKYYGFFAEEFTQLFGLENKQMI